MCHLVFVKLCEQNLEYNLSHVHNLLTLGAITGNFSFKEKCPVFSQMEDMSSL